jgi:putative transcriptional regulator
MEIKFQENLKGHLLLAMPGLMDPNFYRTVTLICEHTREGAMGVIIDRPLDGVIAETIFRELHIDFLEEMGKIPLYFGGPVHTGEIFVLHGPPFHWGGCHRVAPSFALSNTMDILEEIAMRRGPSDFIITLGCSGWGGGQLESEMKENAWLTCPATPEIAFKTPTSRKWMMSIQEIGIDPNLLSGEAGHA